MFSSFELETNIGAQLQRFKLIFKMFSVAFCCTPSHC